MSEATKKAMEFMQASVDNMTDAQLAYITGYAACAAARDQGEVTEEQTEEVKEE